MGWNEIVTDGRKWIALAMVISAVILYLGFTKSYRDCVSAYQEGAQYEKSEKHAKMTCHLKGG